MATHSSVLAWKIPWTEEPDRLQSVGLSLVGRLLAKTAKVCLIQTILRATLEASEGAGKELGERVGKVEESCSKNRL